MRSTNTTNRIDTGDSNYQDNGCELFSKCIECPLPICVYDATDYNQRALTQTKIFLAITPETTAADIARDFNMTERQGYRQLSRYRASGGNYKEFILGSKNVV